MISANNPNLVSWVPVPEGSDFPIQNIPFGVFQTDEKGPRVAAAIGDMILDLSGLFERRYFEQLNLEENIFDRPSLNDFMAQGPTVWRAVRQRISDLLNIENISLQNFPDTQAEVMHKMDEVEMLLPVEIRDYTDFYSSEEHATNVGIMFRGKENALMPNWKHMPIGYHGRASSIIASGTPIHRPKGQTRPNDDEMPIHSPSRLLDFELEMGFVIGKPTELGQSLGIEESESHVFGMAIFNDWSARDIQKWEYQPLGPFLGKSFASSLSPWIVTMDALDHFRVNGPEQNPSVLPYLQFEGKKNLDIQLEVQIAAEDCPPVTVSRSNHKYLYWNIAQQVAHHTINGCNLNVGDLMASGTISGPTPDSYGSMLELSWRGSKPLPMPDGSERKFLLDGDTVIMKAFAEKEGLRIGFGEVRTKILPVL